MSSKVMLDMALGYEVTATDASSPLPPSAEMAAATGFDRMTARRARHIVLDALCCAQEDAVAKAWQDHGAPIGPGGGSNVDEGGDGNVNEGGDGDVDEGGDGNGDGSQALCSPVAMKFAWDETALKMFIPHEAMQNLFPAFDFGPDGDAAQPAGRAKRGTGTRPSFTVQIMQSQSVMKVGSSPTRQVMTPAKIVHTTAAADLNLPVQLYLPTAELSALPQQQPALLALCADSFKPNKLIIQHVSEQLPNIPVVDSLCFGCFIVVLVVAGIYSTKVICL